MSQKYVIETEPLFGSSKLFSVDEKGNKKFITGFPGATARGKCAAWQKYMEEGDTLEALMVGMKSGLGTHCQKALFMRRINMGEAQPSNFKPVVRT